MRRLALAFTVALSVPGGAFAQCGGDFGAFLGGLKAEMHEGGRHIATALIVASEIEGGELICSVKRETLVTDRAALDFVRAANAPVGYLPPA